MTQKKSKKKNIDDLKQMLQELLEKVGRINENQEEPSREEENPLQDDSGAKKGKPDNMAEAYRAAYQNAYNELPSRKKQVVDGKSKDFMLLGTDDRIYKEFIKQVIRDAESV